MSAYEELQTKYKKVLNSCEVCDSGDVVAFQNYGRVAEPGEYGTLPISICKVCGFKMQNPRYEDQFYRDYYDAMYREVAFGQSRPSDEYIEQQKRRGAGVLEFVEENGVKPGLMLDHGCASGATMFAWRDKGWSVKGIDPHRPSVETGREMGLDIEIAAGEDLPFSEGIFDLILSLGSFEHSYDLNLSLSEAARVMQDGGHLVIRWRSNVIFGSPIEYYNHNHYRFFTPNTWQLSLEKNGFSIVSTTDRKLEGWDSYAYILARKQGVSDENRVRNLIDEGVHDDYEAEVAQLKDLRQSYYSACQKFLRLAKGHAGRPQDLAALIKSGKIDFHWGLLGGEPEDTIARSQMEAERYIAEYENGRIV